MREQPSLFNLYGKYGAKYSAKKLGLEPSTDEALSIKHDTSRAQLTKAVGPSRRDIFIDEKSAELGAAGTGGKSFDKSDSHFASRTFLHPQNSSERLQINSEMSLPQMLSGNLEDNIVDATLGAQQQHQYLPQVRVNA